MTLPNRCRAAAENWLDTKGLIPCLLRECAEALEAAATQIGAALAEVEQLKKACQDTVRSVSAEYDALADKYDSARSLIKSLADELRTVDYAGDAPRRVIAMLARAALEDQQ